MYLTYVCVSHVSYVYNYVWQLCVFDPNKLLRTKKLTSHRILHLYGFDMFGDVGLIMFFFLKKRKKKLSGLIMFISTFIYDEIV